MQPMQVNLGLIDVKTNEMPMSSEEIRSSMSRLPKWTQNFLTWLTTQPLKGQNYPARTSIYQVITAFLSLVSGVLLSILILQLEEVGYPLLLISWLITVSGMRKLQVVIYHHCSHGLVFKTNRGNFILGEFLSIMMVIKDFRTYQRDHMSHHRATKLLTYEDETAQDLGEIGLVPGLSKTKLWIRLLFSFISPVSHTRWILNRVRNCFLSLNFVHNIFAIFFWVGLGLAINHYNIWNQFILVWLFPFTVLYHISRILRLVAEHRWPSAEVLAKRGKHFICMSTVAVCNGEPLPPKTESYFNNFIQFSYWLFKMIFIHLIARVFVLVGDTPCHDYHHRRPSSRAWSNYILAREEDKQKGSPGYPINYMEEWGIINALNANLKSLSEVKLK